MKHVFPNVRDATKAWAEQKTPYGRSRTGTVSFEGRTLYSSLSGAVAYKAHKDYYFMAPPEWVTRWGSYWRYDPYTWDVYVYLKSHSVLCPPRAWSSGDPKVISDATSAFISYVRQKLKRAHFNSGPCGSHAWHLEDATVGHAIFAHRNSLEGVVRMGLDFDDWLKCAEIQRARWRYWRQRLQEGK